MEMKRTFRTADPVEPTAPQGPCHAAWETATARGPYLPEGPSISAVRPSLRSVRLRGSVHLPGSVSVGLSFSVSLSISALRLCPQVRPTPWSVLGVAGSCRPAFWLWEARVWMQPACPRVRPWVWRSWSEAGAVSATGSCGLCSMAAQPAGAWVGAAPASGSVGSCGGRLVCVSRVAPEGELFSHAWELRVSPPRVCSRLSAVTWPLFYDNRPNRLPVLEQFQVRGKTGAASPASQPPPTSAHCVCPVPPLPVTSGGGLTASRVPCTPLSIPGPHPTPTRPPGSPDMSTIPGALPPGLLRLAHLSRHRGFPLAPADGAYDSPAGSYLCTWSQLPPNSWHPVIWW